MNHLDIDIDISPEEIARLGRERPFWKFATFPVGGITCSFPGDFTEKIDMVPLTLEIRRYPILGEKPKETYISPFTGRIT